MDLTDLDLSRLRYNPASKNSLKRLEQEHVEFQSHLNPMDDGRKSYNLEHYRYEIFKYIILVYDMKSPLWDMYQNQSQRQIEALKLAGIEQQSNGEFPVEIQQGILYCKNSVVNHMVIRYVSLFNNVRFMQLVGLLEVYTKLALKLRTSDPDKNNVSIFNQTALDIERLTEEVFGGKQNIELENTLYEMLSFNKILFRPEHIAERKRQGEELTNEDPYEQATS